MMENIIDGIRRYYPVSDRFINELVKHLVKRKFPKHHLLIKAGIKDNFVYFIEQGCARTFLFINEKEII